MNDASSLQNSLRQQRARLGLTQEDVAQQVGVTRQTIISIEKGEYVPSLTLGMRLAQAFGVAVEELFTLNQ